MTEDAKKIADELVQDLGSAHADRIGIQLAKAGFGFLGTPSVPTTPNEKAEAWVAAHEQEHGSTANTWEWLAKLLANGKTIDELYAEIKE